MGIARLTEQIIEYLLISSALLFLLGMFSLITVRFFKLKGKTKIWIYALIFILPVIYPFRSILPESIKISVPLQSEYLKPLTGVSVLAPVSTEPSLSQGSPVVPDKITGSKINNDVDIEKSLRELRERAIDTSSIVSTNWKQVAAIIWVLIFSIFFIRLIVSLHTIKRFLRFLTPVTDQRIIGLLSQCASDTGLPYVPLLYEVQNISTPMAMGFFKPVIVIPGHLVKETSIEGLRFTMLHELKHIDQRHNLWLFIESLIGALYFFHPVIHWAKRKIHEEMEYICDGHVIKITQKSVTYADFLLNEIWKNSPGRYPAFSLPFISSASKTATRIRSILENRVASAPMSAREVIALASVCILFLFFMFFTGATRVQGPTSISSFKTADRATSHVLPGNIENKIASSVKTPLPSPAENKAKETHEVVAPLMNAEITNKREYVSVTPYQKADTDPVKEATSTADNTDMKKTIQTLELIPEQPESIQATKSEISMDISQTADNPITEIMEDIPPTPEITAQKYLGPPVTELTIYRIDNIKVLDQYTIIFIMRGGDMYLTRLSDPCPALLYTNDFNLDSTTGKLTKFDRIHAISNGQVTGSTDMLGEFYPYKYKGNKAEAINLLKKELLKIFVAEGALNPT